jgi:hypothetical protein
VYEIADMGFSLALGPTVPAEAGVERGVFVDDSLDRAIDRHRAQVNNAPAMGCASGLNQYPRAFGNRIYVTRDAVDNGIKALQRRCQC